MNILLLNTQMERAGAQKAMLSLASGLRAHGHDIWVATMYDKASCIPALSKETDIHIINLEMRSPKKWAVSDIYRFFRGIIRLIRILKYNKIDVLQSFTRYSNWIGPIAGKISGVSVRVSSQRNSNRADSPLQLKIDAMVANSNLVQAMTCVSESTRKFCIEKQGMKDDKLYTIYNGLASEPKLSSVDKNNAKERIYKEFGFAPENVIISMIARLYPQKGHAVLIPIIPDLLKTFPCARFLIIGSGPLRTQIERHIHEMNVSDKVILTGTRSDVEHLLDASTLLILPSLWEGMPNILLEAMAAGTPVIASDIDGCSEIISNGITGLLVPPGDKTALKTAITHFLINPELAKQIAQNAQAIVHAEFSQETTTCRYINLYERLLRHD